MLIKPWPCRKHWGFRFIIEFTSVQELQAVVFTPCGHPRFMRHDGLYANALWQVPAGPHGLLHHRLSHVGPRAIECGYMWFLSAGLPRSLTSLSARFEAVSFGNVT
jgi:hypothetical protein